MSQQATSNDQPTSTGQPAVRQLARSRRFRELWLLLLAAMIVVGAYAALWLSKNPRIPTETMLYMGLLVGFAVAGHIAVRILAPSADPVILPCVFLLNGLGLVVIRRIDYANNTNLATAQTTWTVVGLAVFAAVLLLLRDHRRLTRYSYTIGLATIVLLLLPLWPTWFPVIHGEVVNGARLWLQVGPWQVQPAEIAKITMVVFLAGYLDRKRRLLAVANHRIGPLLLPAPRHLAPVLAAAGAALLIMVFQRDLGTSLLLFGAFVAMLYLGTGRLAYPAIGLLAFGTGSYVAYRLFAHVRLRVAIWLEPFARANDEGYQIVQALFAFATGGLTGTGLGLGLPGDIPYVATDAIFAAIGEELGLLGATAVLLVYMLVLARGYRVAIAADDEFGTLLAAGLTTILGFQVFVIIGGITRLIPLTGITLPFISYGGSSLISNYLLVALLLRVSDDAREVGRSSGQPRDGAGSADPPQQAATATGGRVAAGSRP